MPTPTSAAFDDKMVLDIGKVISIEIKAYNSDSRVEFDQIVTLATSRSRRYTVVANQNSPQPSTPLKARVRDTVRNLLERTLSIHKTLFEPCSAG